ncbi:MAG: DUF3575 domain-containing protein [Bacteroidales bacterium]|jgi:hypothetical protein
MRKAIAAVIIAFMATICQAQKFGIRSNLIGLATGSLNIEVSKAISDKITLHFPISWNPFIFDNNKKINHTAIQPGIRLWQWHSYSGLFYGIQAIGIVCNIGIKEFRYYGSGVGGSLSFGYSRMLTKNLNIEAETGLGGGWIAYDKYQRQLCGEFEGSWRGYKICPTRVSISIMYIF